MADEQSKDKPEIKPARQNEAQQRKALLTQPLPMSMGTSDTGELVPTAADWRSLCS
jgi:hypothetical protein